MALSPREQQVATRWYRGLPGARGQIPPDVYDTIYSVGNGITLPLWGRPILPHQIDALHKMGADTPAAIHAAFNSMPHPHAPGVSIGEFQDYAHALKTYQDHK
jgi:hypothetical protein